MTDHRTLHSLRRSLFDITVDTAEAKRSRDRAQAPLLPGNFDQRIQLPIDGRVGRDAVFTDGEVYWPHPFLMSIQPSLNGYLETPHFTYGVTLNSEAHVVVDAQVRDWITDDRSLLVGARVRITAWAPTAPRKTSYAGVVHMTFAGYAAPEDEETN